MLQSEHTASWTAPEVRTQTGSASHALHEAAVGWLLAHRLPNAGLAVSDRLPVPYPEVTGYAIPTLLECGEQKVTVDLARWLLSVQRPDGGFEGADGQGEPYLFDTGQVLRGLLALGDALPGAMDAARRAADWMLAAAGESGIVRPRSESVWSQRYAPKTNADVRRRRHRNWISEDIHLYALPPLLEAGRLLGEPKYLACAERSLDYYVQKPDLVCWRYLTHFYGYVLEALVDLGRTDLARTGLQQVIAQQTHEGAIPAVPGAKWICVPGAAQLAIVGYKLGLTAFANAAMEYLQQLQMPSGGFLGSDGPGAAYYSDAEISWACKFFLDACNWRTRTTLNVQAGGLQPAVDGAGRHLAPKSAGIGDAGDNQILAPERGERSLLHSAAWRQGDARSFVAQGFAAYQQGQLLTARRFFVQALRQDVSWITTPRLLSIILESVIGRRMVRMLRRLAAGRIWPCAAAGVAPTDGDDFMLALLAISSANGDDFMLALLAISSAFALLAVGAPAAYLYVLALASIRRRPAPPSNVPHHRFAIAIPAHDEEAVIERTVTCLRELDYPSDLFDIHVVADHCSDRTAQVAQAAGAIVHERRTELRGSKGAALRWLFQRILDKAPPTGPEWKPYDAVVVFDADTRVARDFLRVMDTRLAHGEMVIQGQHRISNPEDGWFPALTAAMFVVDNRFQNLGRANLGCSAKNMGDSICFRAEVLRRLGWGEGLTEDYAFRQRLLLGGITIAYEPKAVGYGEAPLTWRVARRQRARWLRGTRDASRLYARQLLREAVRRRSLPLLEGALQAYLPSYSSLVLVTTAVWLTHVAIFLTRASSTVLSLQLLWAWSVLEASLVIYPLAGLALERAPLRTYLAILSGPAFIVWRTCLAITSRVQRRVVWVRTPRKAEQPSRAGVPAHVS